MAVKDQSRAPTAVDPFTAAFGNALPVPSATPNTPPVATSPSPTDPFEAAFGPSAPAGRPRPSAVPPSPVVGYDTMRAHTEDAPPPSNDLGATTALTGNLISGIPVVGPKLKDSIDQGVAWLRSLSSGKPPADELSNIQAASAATDKAHPIAAKTGELGGQVAGYTGLVATAPVAFGIGAASLPAGMTVSGGTNALIAAADAYARGQDVTKAGIVGGAVGAVAPGIGQAVEQLFTGYIRPAVAQLADLAINRYHIPIGPDLISTNPMVRFASSVMDRMPLSGGAAAKEARQIAYNRAVAQTFGENANELDPVTMQRARTRIGRDFEYAAQNTPQIGADAQFGQDLTRIWDEINHPVDRALTSDERNVLAGHFRRILDMFQRGNGSISGQEYQQMTRRGTALSAATESNNPNIRHGAIQLEGALNDALLRFAPPDAAQTLRQARQQWWAMKTVEDLAEISPTGDVSPARMIGKVRANSNDMAYGGGGDLADLARIGSLFLKESPSSGTAERSLIIAAVEALFSGGGAYLAHHPLGFAAGAAVPVALGRAAAMVARSPRIANRLVQSAIHGPGPVMQAARPAVAAGLPAMARPLIQDFTNPDNERGRYVR